MGIARVKQENQQPFSIYLLPSAAFLWNAEASSSTIAKQNRYSQMNMKPPMEVVAGVEAPLVSLPRSASALLQGLGKSQLAQDPPPNMGVLCCPSFLSCALSICCPFSWLGSCRIVNEKEGALLLTFGKFTTVIKQPGCYFLNPCGTTLTKVSTKQQTTDLPNVKLLDLKGNPVVVSGVVFWQIEGIKASVLNVENVYRYVNTTAMATLKQVVSKYPYEEDHDHVFGSKSGATSSKPGLSLKTEAAQVARELKDVLQDRLAHAGVSVIFQHDGSFLRSRDCPSHACQTTGRSHGQGPQAYCEGSRGHLRRRGESIAGERSSDVSSRENESGDEPTDRDLRRPKSPAYTLSLLEMMI